MVEVYHPDACPSCGAPVIGKTSPNGKIIILWACEGCNRGWRKCNCIERMLKKRRLLKFDF